LTSSSTFSSNWVCKLFVAPSVFRRVFAFPAEPGATFDADLQSFCDNFIAPASIPPARQTYNANNPIHMSDLSIRWMGAGEERLKRTLELNRHLLPTTGRVPTLNFPQGKFAQSQTPKVRKGKVHHLHRASICEALFTDTFETGDHKFHYGQAFVDYRSRYGDDIPLRSRKQVGWAFGEFCCQHFAHLILVRDNIPENKGRLLLRNAINGECRAHISALTPRSKTKQKIILVVSPPWRLLPWYLRVRRCSSGFGEPLLCQQYA
jgi:hypothetical protein